MVSLKEVEREINKLKLRNKKVEAVKAWETSFFRRVIIAVMTYLIIVLFFWVIEVSYYWLNALVPTAGFVLSTLSLPVLKKWWIKRNS